MFHRYENMNLLLLCFSGHFSRWAGVCQYQNISIVYFIELMEMMVELQDVQSSSQVVTTNKPSRKSEFTR